jgi:pseudouridine synthase
MAAPIRLQKHLADHGIASRRKAEEMICAGKVRVNGQVIRQMGVCIDPEGDSVEVEGRALAVSPPERTVLVHKPVQVVSTCSDPQGRTTVIDLIPEAWRRGQGLHPVGRLDFESSGALLVTNDGELTFRLTHPRHRLPKTYEVLVAGQPDRRTLALWRTGVLLEGKRTLPARVEILDDARDRTLLEIALVEGRNRQIRKVAQLLGHPVLRLHRVAIGRLRLGELPPGGSRLLQDAEVKQLRVWDVRP